MGRLATAGDAREARRMPRRTREVWSNLVGQLERSGKTAEQFAAERQIPVGTLRSWIYRLKREKAEEATAILPVRVISSASPSGARRREYDESGAVEVVLLRFDRIVEVLDRLRRC
jgi:hypothetical protein